MLCCVQFLKAQTPTASYSHTRECQNQSVTFNNLSSTPTGTLVQYKWEFGTGDIGDTSNLENPSFTYTVDGIYGVTLIVWNSLGLADTTSQTFRIHPTPKAAAAITTPCFPFAVEMIDNTTISSGTATTRLWAINGSTSVSSIFYNNPISTGNYNIKLWVKSDKNCEDSISQNITYTDPPNISFTPNAPLNICKGDSIFLFGNGANNYIWNDSINSKDVVAKERQYYVVEGFTSNGCSSKDSIFANVIDLPVTTISNDTTISIGNSIMLSASGGVSYKWTPEESLTDPTASNPTAKPIETTTYVVRVTNSGGCSILDSVTITIDTESHIPIPNMITPNNDGYNDAWNLANVPNLGNASVHIFNRWGWEIYKSEKYQNNWKGTYNGEPLPDGTYIYVIKFTDNSREPLRGTLEILTNTQK